MTPFQTLGFACCSLLPLMSTQAQEIWHWDGVGHEVSGAGDLDGDGTPDILSGTLPVFDGLASAFSGATGARLLTFTPSLTGFPVSLSSCGDLNGDGIPDLLMGADLADNAKGRALVYSGATGNTLYALMGESSYDSFGHSVSGAGDLDGDGFGDFIIGAPGVGDATGRTYAYSGATGSVLFVWDGKCSRTSSEVRWRAAVMSIWTAFPIPSSGRPGRTSGDFTRDRCTCTPVTRVHGC
jgi:FG-GAP repeat